MRGRLVRTRVVGNFPDGQSALMLVARGWARGGHPLGHASVHGHGTTTRQSNKQRESHNRLTGLPLGGALLRNQHQL